MHEDTEERAAALEAIATATAGKEQAPPVVDVEQKRANTNIGVVIGVILQVGGLFLSQFGRATGEWGVTPGLVIAALGIPPLIWGCMNYAEAKGYSKEVGLIGLLGIIGLIILVLLPDKYITYLPVPRWRKIVGWISLILGCALIAWGFGARSWLHAQKNSYAHFSLEQKTSYNLAKSGFQLIEGNFKPLGWYEQLLYDKDAAVYLILLGGCLIVASLVMLLYQRKKPQPESAHEGET